MFKWLSKKSRRDVLAFLGAGIAAIGGTLWTGFVYFDKREHPDAKPTPPAVIAQTQSNQCV
jgi:hypothetical protein